MSHHVRESVWELLGVSVTAVLLAGCAAEDVGGGKVVGNDVSAVTVQGIVHAADGVPLASVEVCERRSLEGDPDSCTTSAAGGAFMLAGVPANELVSLTFRRDGFVPMLRSVLTGAQDVRLPESENVLLDATAPQTFLGIASDPSRGQVAFRVESAGGAAPDVVATLTEVDGSPCPRAGTATQRPRRPRWQVTSAASSMCRRGRTFCTSEARPRPARQSLSPGCRSPRTSLPAWPRSSSRCSRGT